jgi:hypothetical protein
VQATGHRDASGDGGSGVSSLIESSDVISDLPQADIIQAQAVLIKPGKIAVEVVSVGVDGACRGPELCCQGIEPELGQPVIGPHEVFLKEDLATASVTNFLSK